MMGELGIFIAPIAFVFSFIGLFAVDRYWPRLAGVYVLMFGFGWLFLIVCATVLVLTAPHHTYSVQ
jgi:hypothetical protein